MVKAITTKPSKIGGKLLSNMLYRLQYAVNDICEVIIMNKKQIIDLYNKGLSAYEILAMTDYKSVNSIYNILRKHTDVRSKAGNKNPNLKHDYFNRIDSEAKAYFLGFIMADGSVTIRKNSQPCLAIEIKEYDSYLLELFKKELCTDNVIETTRKECKRIRVHSSQIVEDLSKYNIIPNKSHATNPAIILEEPYMSHYIRGLMDGDGWVYERQYSLTMGICGTYELMGSIRDYLIKKLHLPNVQVNSYKDRIPFFTHQSIESIDKLYHYLYDDATIFLTRKKSVFDKCQRRGN